MFSAVSNASKVAFVALVSVLRRADFHMIDCQIESEHLNSLGARSIKRVDFEQRLRLSVDLQTGADIWRLPATCGRHLCATSRFTRHTLTAVAIWKISKRPPFLSILVRPSTKRYTASYPCSDFAAAAIIFIDHTVPIAKPAFPPEYRSAGSCEVEGKDASGSAIGIYGWSPPTKLAMMRRLTFTADISMCGIRTETCIHRNESSSRLF